MSRSRTALLLPRFPVPHRRSVPGRRQAAPRPLPERVPSKDRSGPVRHPSGKVRSPDKIRKTGIRCKPPPPFFRNDGIRRDGHAAGSGPQKAPPPTASVPAAASKDRNDRLETNGRFHGIRFLRFFVGLCADTRSVKRIRHTAVRCNGLENRLPPHRTPPERPEPARLRGKDEGFQKRTSTRSAA